MSPSDLGLFPLGSLKSGTLNSLRVKREDDFLFPFGLAGLIQYPRENEFVKFDFFFLFLMKHMSLGLCCHKEFVICSKDLATYVSGFHVIRNRKKKIKLNSISH